MFVSYHAIAIDLIEKHNNKVIVKSIKNTQYANSLEAVLTTYENVIESIQSDLKTRSHYKLTKISFGIKEKITIGIGPWSIGAGLRQRFYFTRN